MKACVSAMPGETDKALLIPACCLLSRECMMHCWDHWNHGASVIRFWAFNDGTADSGQPIQNPVGVYHETALQRFDYVLATCNKIGLRLLPALVNFWDQYGGLSW